MQASKVFVAKKKKEDRENAPSQASIVNKYHKNPHIL